MPYLDGLPTADSASLDDYVAVAQGGTTDRPGTATVRKATLEQIFEGIGISALFAAPPPIGSTTPNTGAFTTLSATNGITFAGGNNAVGTIYTDANWGGLIRGRSGAFADLALESSTANIGLKLAASGDVTMPFNLTTAGLTSSNRITVTPGGRVMSGTGLAQSQFAVFDSWTGTASTADAAILNSIITTSDTIDAASSGVRQLSMDYTFGGSAMKGFRVGLAVQAGLASESGNTAGGSYVAAGFTTNIGANDHGTAGGAGFGLGEAFGGNFVVHLNSAATYWGGAAGVEINTLVETGASVVDKIGMQIVQVVGDNVAGSRDNVAFSIGNQFTQAVGKGWSVGIEFGRQGGYFPMNPNGALFAAASVGGTMIVDKGIYFPNVTFTTTAITLPGFTVDGSGNTYAHSLSTFFGTNTQGIAINGTTTGVSPILQMVGSDTNLGLRVLSKGTGSFSVESHSGLNIMFASTALAASTDYPLLRPGTAALPVQITAVSNNIILGGTANTNYAGLATNATVGFPLLPICSGTPTGTVVANTSGSAIVIDVTASKIWVNISGTWKSVAVA